MPPPKQACQLMLQIQLASLKLYKAIEKVRRTTSDVLGALMKLKFGIIDLADVIGAELVAAIGAIATSVAQAMLGAISQVASSLFGAILAMLLKVILSFPTAIFSLVAIPHDQAIQASNKERIMLSRAFRNLRTIMRIILKWTKGFGGTKFYDQMKEALPYIQKAISLSVDILNGLEGEDDASSDVPNAQFNEGKYKQMQRNIQQAIEITKPHSVLDSRARITKSVERSRERYYQKAALKINAYYDEKKRVLVREYKREILQASKGGESLTNALLIEDVRIKYSFDRKVIEGYRKQELATAEFDAAAKASVDKSAYARAIGGIAAEFVEDMEELGRNLEGFVKNTKEAFVAYKRCQSMCNVMYKIRELITNLINEIIDMLRKTSGATAAIATTALETAQDLLKVTEDTFVDGISRYEDASSKISSIEMSAKVIKGNSLISTADAIMRATITQSLVDRLNADDVLGSDNEEFEKFYKKLERIPDWDGKSEGGVTKWATNPTSAALSPYLDIISGAAELLVKVPVMALSSTRKGSDEVLLLISTVNRTFNSLFVHNSEVKRTLTSYRPYMSSEGGNLKRILESAGLLETFATGMSVAAVLTDIIIANDGSLFDDVLPTYTNCFLHYPDLYTNEDAALAVAYSSGNISVRPSSEAQKENEYIATERDGVVKYLINYDIDIPDENLKTPSSSFNRPMYRQSDSPTGDNLP